MIPTGLITQGGAVALLAAVVWMTLTGRLVPRRNLLDVQADRDLWRKTAERAMEQNNALLASARVTTEVIRALPDAAAGERA